MSRHLRGRTHLLLAAFATYCATPVRADQAPDLAAFDRALAKGDIDQAAAIYGKFFEARLPTDGQPRADALLDNLVGRLSLAQGDPVTAQAFLLQPDTGGDAEKATRQLALAHAELTSGAIDDARRTFEMPLQSGTSDQHVQAILGQAQVALLVEPEKVPTLLMPLPASLLPSGAWRVAFIGAQAALALGDMGSAQTLADRASLLAPSVPVREFAVMQTLQLQAALAVAKGDTARTDALLSTIPSSDEASSMLANAMADRGPFCGQNGVNEQDFVTVGLITQSDAPIVIPSPVGASRPSIVSVFMRSIAGYWRSGRGVSLVTGPLLKIRCRRNAPVRFTDDAARKSMIGWAASRHLRPRSLWQEFMLSDTQLADVGRSIDRVEEVVGKDSPILAPLLQELAFVTAMRLAQYGDVSQARPFDLAKRATILAQRAGGIPFAVPADEMGYVDKADIATVKARIIKAPADFAYAIGASVLNNGAIPDGERLDVATLVAQKFEGSNSGRTAQAILTQRIGLLRSNGKGEEALNLAKSVKRDITLCQNKAEVPNLVDSGITDNDYTRDAIFGEISGATVVELDIDANGNVKSYREIVEAPPLSFSAALKEKVYAIKFRPDQARHHGPLMCKAYRQNIRWRLPTSEDFTPQPLGLPSH